MTIMAAMTSMTDDEFEDVDSMFSLDEFVNDPAASRSSEIRRASDGQVPDGFNPNVPGGGIRLRIDPQLNGRGSREHIVGSLAELAVKKPMQKAAQVQKQVKLPPVQDTDQESIFEQYRDQAPVTHRTWQQTAPRPISPFQTSPTTRPPQAAPSVALTGMPPKPSQLTEVIWQTESLGNVSVHYADVVMQPGLMVLVQAMQPSGASVMPTNTETELYCCIPLTGMVYLVSPTGVTFPHAGQIYCVLQIVQFSELPEE